MFDETDSFLRNSPALSAPANALFDVSAALLVSESVPPSEGESVELAENAQEDLVEAEPVNDYPELPTSGELDAAVEETDATLRRMREHLTSDEPSKRPRRVSRFVTLSAG